MEQKKKCVLVSGGAGYIGSHVTVELIEAGYDVVVADNLSNCDLTCFEGVRKITGRDDIPFEQIDCCDQKLVDMVFEKYRIDAVIHFAAFKAVGESVAEPIKYYKNNLTSFLNILDAAKNHGGCNVLFSSSATVYGETDKLPVTEESPRQPAQSSYGATKQICEDILTDVVRATGAYGSEILPGKLRLGPVKGIALRYFNPIGAHPSAEIGELPNGVPNNLLPYVAQAAAGIRKKLKVFGGDYNTPDGSCIRDYIDIMDLAKAHVCAMKRLIDGKVESVETFNLGTGRGLSVLEIIKTFEEVNDIKVPYEMADRREGDIEQVWADPTYANEVLKWEAKESVKNTLRSVWKWQMHLMEQEEDHTKGGGMISGS